MARDAAGYFGDRVAHYDSHYEQLNADGHALRSRMEAVLELAGAGPGDALDAGMGPGRLSLELAARAWKPSGVDASAEMVAVARSRMPEAQDRLLVAPIEALPFADGSFDLVTATGVLEYADVEAALCEISRVLRPDGRAVVSYPNPQALYGIWKTRLWYPIIRFGKRTLRRPDPEMPRGGGQLAPPDFARALAAAGLEPTAVVHTSYLALVTPLERLFPMTTVRLGERLESRGRRGRLLATQIVYEARPR